MTDRTTVTGSTLDRRPVTDGGRLVLRYGMPADAIGEPDRVFVRFDGEFAMLPRQTLEWSLITDNETEDGVVVLDDAAGTDLGRLRSALEPADIDSLARLLVDNSDLDELGAKVLLLFEGFELDPPEVAAELDVPEGTVVEHIEEIYDRYDEDAIVDAVQERHPEIPDDLVRAFVLAEGFGWEADEIAGELGVDVETVETHLDTAREDHEELAETLQDVV